MSQEKMSIRPFVLSLLRRIYRARPEDDDQSNRRRRGPDLYLEIFDFFGLLYTGRKPEPLSPSSRGAFRSQPPTAEEVRLVREAILGRMALERERVPQGLVAALERMPGPEVLGPMAELYRGAIQHHHAGIAMSCLFYIEIWLHEGGVSPRVLRRVRRIMRECLPIVQAHAREHWQDITEMNYNLVHEGSLDARRGKAGLSEKSGLGRRSRKTVQGG